GGRRQRRATPRRRDRSRSPPRRACGSAARSPGRQRSASPLSLPSTGCYSASPRSALANSQEVERAVEVAAAQPEVPGADRRDEAVVERPREAKRRVDAIPAQPDGELMGLQLAGVEDAEQLDAREAGLEQGAVLALVVLTQMPGVVRLLGAGRREREPVGGGDVG